MIARPRTSSASAHPKRFVTAITLIALLSLTAAVLAACERAPAPQPSNAAASATKKAHATPRIVALAPGIASSLRSAGLADHIVGRHAFDTWSDPQIPIVGDQEGIDFERLISAQPTHVFLQWGARPLPERLETLARERSWQLVNYPLLTLDETITAADDLVTRVDSALMGHSTPSTVPSSPTPPARVMLRSQLDTIFAQLALTAAQRATLGPVLILHTTSPPAALGPGSYHDDIARRLNVDLAIKTGSPYMTLDAEDIATMNPSVIVLIQPADAKPTASADGSASNAQPASTATINDRLGTLATLNIDAVKRSRVILIDNAEALLPGAPLVDVARTLAEKLRTLATDTTPPRDASSPGIQTP